MKKLLLGLFVGAVGIAMADPKALAQQKGCFACHDVNTKKVGPAYKDIAAKGKKVEELVNSIKKGSSGKWGPIPMPPQSVSDDEAKKLAEWINSLK